MELEKRRIAVIGLGLIGGSLALALRRRCRQVIGVDTDGETVELARQAGISAHHDLRPALHGADVLVLATPVGETLRLLKSLATDPPHPELLLDVGSTKRQIMQAMEALPDHLPAVGGHPLCGKERSGFRLAEADLFRGSPFVLVRCARTTPTALALAEQLVRAVGASPRWMPATTHDRLLATASHLPYLLAAGLMDTADRLGRREPKVWETVASGFLGASRLAASDLTMMLDILMSNRDMTLSALAEAQAALEGIRGLLAEGHPEPLRAYLEPLRQRRLALQPSGGNLHAD